MGIVLVTGMPLEPHHCVACGKGPRDETGTIRENAFAEGVDINWGDSVYICPECGKVIGELYGMMRAEEAEHLTARVERLEAVAEAFKEYKDRVKVVLEGQRARKELTSA